jgi:hypothetical protein
MQWFITLDDPEEVSLARAYFHFVGSSPSERQAIIDLTMLIRCRRLKLRAGQVREFRPGEAQPCVRYNEAIPSAALDDRLGMKFDLEHSSARWKNPSSGSYVSFEDITVTRDQVLELRLVRADISGENIAKLEQQVSELQQRPAPPLEAIAKLEQGMAELQQWLVPEELAALKQQVAELQLRVTSSGPHPGGAPRRYDREQILMEGAVLIVVEGLPSSFEDFYGKVADRLGDESPGDTLLKKVLRPLYQKMKAALGCAETPDGQ